jgi:4-amino-4-deoxy-L-arabinose transferase-like glycosyltransferase
MGRKLTAVAFVLLTLLPLARVAATWHVFSRTVDEPAHVGAGREWLEKGTYQRDVEHPPLARVLEAIASRLGGGGGDEVIRARAGNLPFLLIALIVVAMWTARLFGNAAALIALALFGALPPVLAHAGLATTDCAAMAMTALALYRFAIWLDEPSWRNAIFCGIAIGLGLIAKFSFVVYFPIGALAFVGSAQWAVRRAQRSQLPTAHRALYIRQIPAVIAVAALLVWAGYRFSAGTLDDARLQVLPHDAMPYLVASYSKVPGYEWVRADHIAWCRRYCGKAARHGVTSIDFADWAKAAGYPSPLAGRLGRDTMAGAPPIHRRDIDKVLEPVRAAEHRFAQRAVIPAPLFFAGIERVEYHSQTGHPAFLLGKRSGHGWWYYFPVVFFFKTPLPFFILCIAGVVMLLHGGQAPSPVPEARGVALAPLLMLIPAMASGINIGLRHILPIYPLLAICAAYAAITMWRHARLRWVLAVLLLWYFAGTAIAHPDYLPYFNELAGEHPEHIAVDSNLDWGQDLKRLGDVVVREHIDPLHVAAFGDWGRYCVAAEELKPNQCVTGWVALSETVLRWPEGEGYEWLEAYRPVKRIGKSIRLYYIAQ